MIIKSDIKSELYCELMIQSILNYDQMKLEYDSLLP